MDVSSSDCSLKKTSCGDHDKSLHKNLVMRAKHITRTTTTMMSTTTMYNYRPQTKSWEDNVFMCVCLSIGGGGMISVSVWLPGLMFILGICLQEGICLWGMICLHGWSVSRGGCTQGGWWPSEKSDLLVLAFWLKVVFCYGLLVKPPLKETSSGGHWSR